MVAHDVCQKSQTLSGLAESSSGVKFDYRPWSGRTHNQTNFVGSKNVSHKWKESIDEGLSFPNIFAGHSTIEGELSG